MIRTLLRPLAAVLVTAAAGLVGVTAAVAPAHAAACTTNTGVTVVVDWNALGGGVQETCDADGGGKKASDLFNANGFALRYAARQPGFVCRVNDKPASDPCVNTAPADAYWSLWWTDGRSGSWTYSSLGAPSLTIPAGGSVAFSWNTGGDRDGPSTAAGTPPPPATSTPAPETGSGSGSGYGGGSGEGRGSGSRGDADGNGSRGSGGSRGDVTDGGSRGEADAPASDAPTDGSSTGADDPAATPSAKAGRERGERRRGANGGKPDRAEARESPSADPTDAASAEATDDASESADPQTTASPPAADGGLPGWVAPGVVVLLFAAAGGVLVLRRRGTPQP